MAVGISYTEYYLNCAHMGMTAFTATSGTLRQVVQLKLQLHCIGRRQNFYAFRLSKSPYWAAWSDAAVRRSCAALPEEAHRLAAVALQQTAKQPSRQTCVMFLPVVELLWKSVLTSGCTTISACVFLQRVRASQLHWR